MMTRNGRQYPIPPFAKNYKESCNNRLRVRQYNDNKSISKVVWVDKQFEKIVQANKRALKSIQARAKVNERSSGDKDFDIPIGNFVLLHDHSEGQNKIQDDYKPDLFEVTGKHSDPNAFFVKSLDGKGPVKQVNWWQKFDLGIMEWERREGESDQIKEDPEVPKAPVYHPRVKIAMKPQGHQYHLRLKGPALIPAPRVSHVKSQGVKLDQTTVAAELLECSRLKLWSYNWSVTKFVDSIRFGLFRLVTVVHFDFCFFSIGLVFFQGIIMWGKGCIEGGNKKWQSQGQSSPLVSWTAALSKPMHHALIFPH